MADKGNEKGKWESRCSLFFMGKVLKIGGQSYGAFAFQQ
jgi:hypothetical protein